MSLMQSVIPVRARARRGFLSVTSMIVAYVTFSASLGFTAAIVLGLIP